MAFDFPASPSVGQVFSPATGIGYQWNGYAWDRLASAAPPVAAVPTPADNQVAVWTSPTALEGTNNLTFDNANGQLKVYYPGGHGLRIAPQAAGNPQVQISPDQASPLPDIGLLLCSKGTPGITFYTSPSGAANFQFAQVQIAHQINSGVLLLSGGEPTSNPNGNIYTSTFGPVQINSARLMGPTPTILNAPAVGDSSDKVPTTAWVKALAVNPTEGRLAYVDTTHLEFKPFQGNKIKINGLIYTIPAAGIVGLTPTNTYVNGVSGQNLVPNTVYRVYCFSNGGVLTADFSTAAHATSQTAGNEGVEIKVNDDTRTLIGMVWIANGPAFVYQSTLKAVRSWFNDFLNQVQVYSTADFYSTDYTPFGAGLYILPWGDEMIDAWCNMGFSSDCSIGVPGYGSVYIAMDNTGLSQAVSAHTGGNGWTTMLPARAIFNTSEILHLFQMWGIAVNGTGHFGGYIYVNVQRGR